MDVDRPQGHGHGHAPWTCTCTTDMDMQRYVICAHSIEKDIGVDMDIL
jgi:hypothetical protein